MSTKTLIIAEHRDGKIKASTLELIAAATTAGSESHIALLGDAVSNLTGELASVGAHKIHLAQNAALKNYTAEAYAQVCAQIVKSLNPTFVLAAHTPTGREFMPKLAAILDVGLASDCNSCQFQGDTLILRKPVYAGKASVEVEFIGAGAKLATIRPNTFPAAKPGSAPKGAGEVVNVAVDLSGLKSQFLESQKGNSARPDVTEAAIVVSGGRSLKSAENFKLLEELADTIGAAVGASRAAVDAGFRPHRDQVGQTGKVVSPSLYIACGISGAIQHMAGMRSSKTIVAINTDPEAPIFQVADYGIVGDLFQVVPALTQEFKKLKDGHG